MHVVPVVPHDVVHGRNARGMHRIYDWCDGFRGIQRIVITILNVERAVREIAQIQIAVDARVAVGEYERLAVERQARRPGVRLAQCEEVGTGAPIRNASQVRLRLVDVVLALDHVEQAEDVVDLARVPPGVLVGGLRLDVDLRFAGYAR